MCLLVRWHHAMLLQELLLHLQLLVVLLQLQMMVLVLKRQCVVLLLLLPVLLLHM